MKLFLVILVIVAFSVFIMCFNIIFRKDGQFPDGEISHSKALREKGIICAKEEELKLWGKKHHKQDATCSDLGCSDCIGCNITR